MKAVIEKLCFADTIKNIMYEQQKERLLIRSADGVNKRLEKKPLRRFFDALLMKHNEQEFILPDCFSILCAFSSVSSSLNHLFCDEKFILSRSRAEKSSAASFRKRSCTCEKKK